MKVIEKLFAFAFLHLFLVSILTAQTPGGVSNGLRTWYKADALSGYIDGQNVSLWQDQYNGDGAYQNAVQNGRNIVSYIGNRQPQFRSPKLTYNFNPYLDFSKKFSSLFAYKAHSNKPDYQWNYTQGSTLYQVGALNNTQGWYLGTGLGATTAPIGGYNYEYGMPWYGLNQQYYGVGSGYYYGTVDDYGWYTFPFPSYKYNYQRPERKTQNGIPYISSVSYDSWATYKTCCVVGTDANTALQTRLNGDKWSWGYNYTPSGPSLYIGNEYTNYNSGRWWNGGIPEVVLYNRKLNTSQGGEADKVDSYLALKYGITLYHNYYLSDGTKVWDTTCNNKFNNQIAGIVKDNASALNQKQTCSNQSKSVMFSLGNLVEFNNADNASIISDKYSIIFGSTNIGMTIKNNDAIPGGFAAISAPPACLNSSNVSWTLKKWMVQEQTGKDIGPVILYIESKDLQSIDWSCQAYIVVGKDESFSNPVYYPLQIASTTIGSTTDYVTEINFCEGAINASTVCGGLKSQYFAIVGKGGEFFPGGVSRGLKFWVRADYGTLNNSTTKEQSISGVKSRVREWLNVAKGPSALPGIAGDAPTLRPSSRYDNFNPMVSFQNYGLNIASGGENYDPDQGTMIATNVLNQNSTTGADSLSLFVSHRNLADWYNCSLGIGDYGCLPGLAHDEYHRNSIEYEDNANGDILQSTIKQFTLPYAGTQPPPFGSASFKNTSSFGRSYQSALFWYPRNPLTITSTTNNIVDMKLRGNGENRPMTTQFRATSMTAHNLTGHRNNVIIAGGTADYGCVGMQDAIVYNVGFNPLEFELERIETYLGIKNGLTILHNYYATDKTLLWDTTSIIDASPNAPASYTRYNRSITGIGRDDLELLHQRVSRNSEDTVLTISIGVIPENDQKLAGNDFQNDKEYIIWGSNGGVMNTRITTDLPTTLPGCIDSRINREYHIHLTGNTGIYNTQVRWQLDNNLLDAVSATSISMLIDDDGDGNFNTGNIRSIPATSYDIATNTLLFDNVNWSFAGDSDPDDAAITIGWSQTTVGRVKLFAGQEVVTPICTDGANWTFYKDAINNKKTVAINWGNNVVTNTVTLSTTNTATNRRKSNLNVNIASYQYDSAAVIGSRMLNVTINSGTITEPVKVRFYIEENEIKSDSTWIIGSSQVGNGGGVVKTILQDSSWTWFKFDGTITDVMNSLSASGLPVTEDITNSTNKMISLIPDETGFEDGIRYVQFNYITSFSTFGYLQKFVKSNDLSALPISLNSFNFSNENCISTINWSTNSENNYHHFELEKSIDNGNNWLKEGIVNATINTEFNYSFELPLISEKINLIRLKIVDIDGNITYSPLLGINCNDEIEKLVLSPNPATNFVTLTGFNPQSEIQIVNSLGEIIEEIISVTNTIQIDLKEYSSGVYFINVKNNLGKNQSIKFIKE